VASRVSASALGPRGRSRVRSTHCCSYRVFFPGCCPSFWVHAFFPPFDGFGSCRPRFTPPPAPPVADCLFKILCLVLLFVLACLFFLLLIPPENPIFHPSHHRPGLLSPGFLLHMCPGILFSGPVCFSLPCFPGSGELCCPSLVGRLGTALPLFFPVGPPFVMCFHPFADLLCLGIARAAAGSFRSFRLWLPFPCLPGVPFLGARPAHVLAAAFSGFGLLLFFFPFFFLLRQVSGGTSVVTARFVLSFFPPSLVVKRG